MTALDSVALGTMMRLGASVRRWVERHPMRVDVALLAPLQAHEIAGWIGLIEEQIDAGEKIRERVLERERDGQRADAERGERGRERHADGVRHEDRDEGEAARST